MCEIKSLPKGIRLHPYTELYYTKDSLYFSNDIPTELKEDLRQKEIMIYSGWYKFHSSMRYPIIYLIGRGKRYGKFYIRVGGFRPYCYVKDENGKYKSIFGDKLERVELERSPPDAIRKLRLLSVKQKKPQPFEADIPFVRRFLIDVNGYFKSKQPLDLNVLILDIETNYPVSDDIISFATNKLWNREIRFISLHDTNKWDLMLELLDDIILADVITGWNIKFDIEHIAKEFANIAFVLKTIM